MRHSLEIMLAVLVLFVVLGLMRFTYDVAGYIGFRLQEHYHQFDYKPELK